MGKSIFDGTMVEMTWPEIEKAAGEEAIVLLPVGIIEEHGPHMGLAVDTCIAALMSLQARIELEKRGIRTLIAPPVYWGISQGTATFGGTFSVRQETMKSLVYDVLASLHSWHLDRVFIINWHADYQHCQAILETVKEARDSLGCDARCLLTEADFNRLRLNGEENFVLIQASPPAMEATGEYVDLHAGSLETGIMLAYYPEYVDEELCRRLAPTRLTYRDLRQLGQSDEETRRLIPHGYFGNPAGFDTAAAREYLEDYSRNLADTIENFVKDTDRPANS